MWFLSTALSMAWTIKLRRLSYLQKDLETILMAAKPPKASKQMNKPVLNSQKFFKSKLRLTVSTAQCHSFSRARSSVQVPDAEQSFVSKTGDEAVQPMAVRLVRIQISVYSPCSSYSTKHIFTTDMCRSDETNLQLCRSIQS